MPSRCAGTNRRWTRCFHSVAQCAGRNVIACLLTGMGKDGARGMLEIRQAGGYTVAQNEATCVVYGMPREAVAIGGAEDILPLGEIAEALLPASAQAWRWQPGLTRREG